MAPAPQEPVVNGLEPAIDSLNALPEIPAPPSAPRTTPAPRDGNCLYFSLAAAIAVPLARGDFHAAAEQLFEKAEVSPVVFESYLESLTDIYASLGHAGAAQAVAAAPADGPQRGTLEEAAATPCGTAEPSLAAGDSPERAMAAEIMETHALLLIGTLRLIASAYLLVHWEDFQAFHPEVSAREYVSRRVDPMGERAGETEITALARALGLRIGVRQELPGSEACEILYGAAEGAGETIWLLHTPDHFDLLHK